MTAKPGTPLPAIHAAPNRDPDKFFTTIMLNDTRALGSVYNEFTDELVQRWNAYPALLARIKKLEDALQEAKSNLQWATGGWGQATKAVLEPARITMAGYLEAIDAVLSAAPKDTEVAQ